MDYRTFLARVIDDGIEAARRDYAGDLPGRRQKREGAVEGFEACRDKEPAGILALLEDARLRTTAARSRSYEGEIDINDYWRVRCRELEIEWVANCVSAMLVNEGLPPIIPPTARAALAVARIVGVKGEQHFN